VRQKFIAGNWKMHGTTATARALAGDIVKGLGSDRRVRVALCPPFPHLGVVAEVVRGSGIALGAQNCYHEKEGAFTGEVSPNMLADLGCEYVILGHSERRHILGEHDAFINRKVHAAFAAGLHVILCIGETGPERESNRTEAVLEQQLAGSLAGVSDLSKLSLAYEPVWAIGTGKVATTEQAQAAHVFIRKWAAGRFGAAASDLIIQYGGSANPSNVASLLHQPDVDGGLIGGASLKADLFVAVVQIAAAKPG
jgi:triosephosphate isomerase